jgi:hypothetical protein
MRGHERETIAQMRMIKSPIGCISPEIRNIYIWWPYFKVSTTTLVSFHDTTMVQNMTRSCFDMIVLALLMVLI